MGMFSKAKWCLFGCLIILLVLVTTSVFVPDSLTNAVKWVANNDSASKLRALTKQEEIQEDKLVEMIVESVGISQIDYQPVVILKQKGKEIYLPIWIGPAEANAISVILEGVEMPRPLTPDLLCSIIDKMGASVNYIVVSDLRDRTFYASVILQANWMRMEIDARPSDAIAIALRVGAPIYTVKAVLDEAGVPLGDEAYKYTTMHVEKNESWVSPKVHHI